MTLLRKFTYIFIAALIAVCSISVASDADAARKKSKAKTTQTAGSKKKSSGKKSSKKNKKKTSSRTNKKSRTTKKKSRSSKKRRYASRKTTYTAPAPETPSYDSLTLSVNAAVLDWIPQNLNPGGLRVNSVKPDKASKIAKIGLNENFTYLPVTRQLIDSLEKHVRLSLPDSISDYRISLNVGNKGLAYYITKVDKLPEKYRTNIPFVVEAEPYVRPKKGMENDIIALWHSHGRYFRSGSWVWQRPLLFSSIEDTYTMSYILPYVVPMLENAGAYVLLPRERDVNPHEVIVDNDTNDEGQIFSQPYYKEMNGTKKWETGELDGFIYDLPDFRDTENPFENGTYRQTATVTHGTQSVAAWYAEIPETREYAVYVSYKTLPNSTKDARYTVNYSGGSKEFIVNQQMGGGTWIYLGTFPLEEGYDSTIPIVSLTNHSSNSGDYVVTADAVKIGGGMGNIARSSRRSDIYYDPSTPEVSQSEVNPADTEPATEEDEEGDDEEDDEEEDETDEESPVDESPDGNAISPVEEKPSVAEVKKGPAPVFRTSGLPRYLEGARYWLQWAGFPEYIYSPYHGSDDYKDDYTSRGHWVNYLAGGSRVLPDQQGLNIPVDVTMALHSDAGKRNDDSFVGTLGIYFTQGGVSYEDGTPRINSRMLTDILMRQITGDIRNQYEPRWTRRSMWDKSYVEARVPEVPTTLIELLSHQNYADMMYGLDPGFRFTVGRAIYKGLARFISERKDRKLVIQPLPVHSFSITRTKPGHYRLNWEATPDPLESTAMPDKYIILERSEGNLGFTKVGETSSTHFDIKVADSDIHSFRVIAANEGGISFPSETLALREAGAGSDPILIVNGFTRVSGPEHFSSDGKAGFNSESDFGVPYIRDISFTGPQTEFRRSAGDGFGRSSGADINKVIAGNTFDFPALHGAAIAANGYGFVSASASSVESGKVNLNNYKVIDLILGRQKATTVGNGKTGVQFETFPEKLRENLMKYSSKGGKMIVSGEYVVSDLFNFRNGEEGKDFARNVLGVEPADSIEKSHSGRIKNMDMNGNTAKSYNYSSTLNDKTYIVQNPDVLKASDHAEGTVMMVFSDTEQPAGFYTKTGKGRNAILSIPFEAILDSNLRTSLMGEMLRALR